MMIPLEQSVPTAIREKEAQAARQEEAARLAAEEAALAARYPVMMNQMRAVRVASERPAGTYAEAFKAIYGAMASGRSTIYSAAGGR